MDLLAAYSSEDEGDAYQSTSSDADEAPVRTKKRAKTIHADGQDGVNTTVRTLLPPADLLLAEPLPTLAAQAAAKALAGSDQAPSQLRLSTGVVLPPEPPRVRKFPHVEGNFATVVYITVDDSAQAKLQELATNLLTDCITATAAAGATAAASASCTASTQRMASKPPANAAAAGAAGTAGTSGALIPSDGSAYAAVPCSSTSHEAADLQAPLETSAVNTTGIYLWPTFDLAPAHAGNAAAVTAPAHAGAAAAGQQRPSQEAAEQQLPLHMSISRTVPIKRIQIESLQAALTKQLKPFKAFRVQLQGLVCLVNDASTCFFVGIKVATGEKLVVRLVEAVNRAFIIHGLQPFYQEALPHVSLAWTPGDQVGRLQPWLESFKHEPIPLKVSQVVCQAGKIRTVVWQG